MAVSDEERAELERRLELLEARVLGPSLDVARVRVMGPRGPVMELGASPDGEPEIVLMDAQGRDRILLRIVEDDGLLEIVTGDGRPQARLAASTAGARLVLWTGHAAERRAEMRAATDGTAVTAILDGEDVRTILGVTPSGEAIVRCEAQGRGGAA